MSTQDTIRGATPKVLNDAELADVTGGYGKYHDEENDRYYIWKNDASNSIKYLCPNCGRPVTAGFLAIEWSCKPCKASWVLEYRLNPNLSAGGWEWVTKEEYDRYSERSPLKR